MVDVESVNSFTFSYLNNSFSVFWIKIEWSTAYPREIFHECTTNMGRATN